MVSLDYNVRMSYPKASVFLVQVLEFNILKMLCDLNESAVKQVDLRENFSEFMK